VELGGIEPTTSSSSRKQFDSYSNTVVSYNNSTCLILFRFVPLHALIICKLDEGIQQPFEISFVSAIEDTEKITLKVDISL